MTFPALQYPFSCTPPVMAEIEAALTPERLARYLRKEPKGDAHRALRLYLWNVRLCEALHAPLHFTEVSVRNGIQRALASHFQTPEWYNRGVFKALLSEPIKRELESTIDKAQRDHGASLTPNHIVAGLSFGFWSHMMTKNFELCGVWPKYFRVAFPHKQPGLQRERVQYRLETIRDYRNRVAHYMAVFDLQIRDVYAMTLEVTGWCSPHSRWLLEGMNQIDAVLNDPPPV